MGTTTLVDKSNYFPLVINSNTIKLFQNIDDFNAGINTVGFTTISKNGIHKFEIFEQQDTLKDIRVTNGGSNYENRQLHVKPTGINTSCLLYTSPSPRDCQ